jgi:hypothetical protein
VCVIWGFTILNLEKELILIEQWFGLKYGNLDYSDFYEISNLFNVRNIKTKIIRKMTITQKGYYQFLASFGSKKGQRQLKLHKCIASTFIPNPENKPFINHIDGNKTNNKLDNIEWCTGKENAQHAWDSGFQNKRGKSKLIGEIKTFIEENYIPRDKEFGAVALSKKYNTKPDNIVSVIRIKNRRELLK